MRNLFSINSPLYAKLCLLTDIMLLNLLYLLCCLPIITIGAARAALCATFFSIAEHKDAGARAFLRAFRENFRPMLLPWAVLLTCGVFLAFDIYLAFAHPFPGSVVLLIFLALFIVAYMLTVSQLFLVQAKFVCTFRHLFGNALLIALAHPIRSIGILCAAAVPWILFFATPEIFIRLSPVWLLCYFSVDAYLSVRIMHTPFRKLAEQK